MKFFLLPLFASTREDELNMTPDLVRSRKEFL